MRKALSLICGPTNGGGQIVGPHGSGKSTLLETLRPRLLDSGRSLIWFTLRNNQRRLPNCRPTEWGETAIVVADGFEQLFWWERQKLIWRCRSRGAGLLVTTHRETRLPTLYKTQTTVELARQIVEQVATARDLPHASKIGAIDDTATCFEEARGDMRETLFSLYDVYERMRRMGA